MLYDCKESAFNRSSLSESEDMGAKFNAGNRDACLVFYWPGVVFEEGDQSVKTRRINCDKGPGANI